MTFSAPRGARSVVVAAPSDSPPIARLQGATYATAIAEHFRDQGQHVLLLMDSLTRYAMAAREIALAIGEAPATKGYPPSVFARMPGLIERTGNGIDGVGSITAFYTVLSEGDDMQDPVADAARSFLDGHIVLSRSLARLRPLPGDRHRAVDLAGDDRGHHAVAAGVRPAAQIALVTLPAKPRADHDRCLRARLGPRDRSCDRADAGDRALPAARTPATQPRSPIRTPHSLTGCSSSERDGNRCAATRATAGSRRRVPRAASATRPPACEQRDPDARPRARQTPSRRLRTLETIARNSPRTSRPAPEAGTR